jgi:CRISPR-associated protein Cmr5
MQTLDQQYAASAYEQILPIKEEKDYKKYGAMAHKLPILIHTAGLVQALEFVNSRGKPIQRRLLDHLAITIGLGNTETLLQTVKQAPLSLSLIRRSSRRKLTCEMNAFQDRHNMYPALP